MNILKILKENNNNIHLKYYGESNMIANAQVQILLNSKEKINEYYNSLNGYINTVDDYIDFLFIDMCSKLSEVKRFLEEDYKEEFSEEIEHISNIRGKYKNNALNKYIKYDYSSILSVEKLKENKLELYIYEIVDITLDYIKNNFKIFKENKEIYVYLTQNCAYQIFNQFDDYKNIFEKYPELFDELFSEQNIKNQIINNISKFELVLKVVKKIDEKLYNKISDRIMKNLKDNYFNTDVKKVLYTHPIIQSATKLFERIGNIHYNELYEEKIEQDKILDMYIHENGQQLNLEININNFVEIYGDSKIGWDEKSLAITHGIKDNKVKSRFELMFDMEREKRLVDMVSTNITTNEYFTYSVQRDLSILMASGKMIIQYMITENSRFDELMNYSLSGILTYLDKFNISISNIQEDFEKIKFTLKNLVVECNKEDSNKLIIQVWNYNVIHLVIGVIEKILRELFYNNVKIKKFIPYSKLTLEYILNSDEIDNIIGLTNKRCLQYYLTSYNFVGKNLRNDICHYNNNINEICINDNTLSVLYLLLTLTNELLAKVINIDLANKN